QPEREQHLDEQRSKDHRPGHGRTPPRKIGRGRCRKSNVVGQTSREKERRERRSYRDAGRRLAIAVDRRPAPCRRERIGVVPGHQGASGATRTSILPKFSPRSSPIRARGAFSRPSTTSSRYRTRPSRSHADTSRRKSPCRTAKSETMKPRKVRRL